MHPEQHAIEKNNSFNFNDVDRKRLFKKDLLRTFKNQKGQTPF